MGLPPLHKRMGKRSSYQGALEAKPKLARSAYRHERSRGLRASGAGSTAKQQL